MNKKIVQPGATMLVIALVMGMLLLLCTSIWRSTTLLVDCAIIKQEHTQMMVALEGIIEIGIAISLEHFDQLQKRALLQSNGIPIPLSHLHFSIPCLQNCKPQLTITYLDDVTLALHAALLQGTQVLQEKSYTLAKMIANAQEPEKLYYKISEV